MGPPNQHVDEKNAIAGWGWGEGPGVCCIERARNISAEANFSAILNYRQVSCDCPFEGINPSTAQF
jgi:hypothetical protein